MDTNDSTSTTKVMLRPGELSERWQVSPGTLSNWRSRGEGPTFVKIGGSVRYPMAAVLAMESGNHRPRNGDLLTPPIRSHR